MTTATPLAVRLRPTDREALTQHFLALDVEDRRLRFGAALNDDSIRALEERIDFERDELFAVTDDELRLLGVVHVAFYEAGRAELGLSVLPCARAQGIGNALFARAVMHLRNRRVREVFVHCLSENSAMMHLARKHGMRLVNEGSETDAWLELSDPTAETFLAEWFHDQQADSVRALRRHAQLTRNLFSIFGSFAKT